MVSESNQVMHLSPAANSHLQPSGWSKQTVRKSVKRDRAIKEKKRIERANSRIHKTKSWRTEVEQLAIYPYSRRP